MKNVVSIPSFSKINLGLKVLNKRSDGFHNIQSLFIEIDLHDDITFTPSNKFKIECNKKSIPCNKTNTIYKAYKILVEKFNFKNQYKIFLQKNIPIQSGLGGGSSNAATVIRTLNKLEHLNLSKNEMLKIASKVGSDVPFFIDGKIKLVEGRGDIIKKYKSPILKKLIFILIIPSFKISTKWAYSKIKNNLHEPKDITKFPALDSRSDWKFFKNDFEDVVGAAYPEIFEIKELLNKNGALYSGLSGSGSTMFGIYNDKELINIIHSKLTKYKTIIVSPI